MSALSYSKTEATTSAQQQNPALEGTNYFYQKLKFNYPQQLPTKQRKHFKLALVHKVGMT